jgi:hypothetical protein
MADINTYALSQNLWKWGILPIPGVCIIKTNYAPAYPDWQLSVFCPPVLHYDVEPWTDDSPSIISLKKNNSEYFNTMTALSTKWSEELDQGKVVDIANIGSLERSLSGELIFIKDEETSLPAYFSSLEKVPFTLHIDRSKIKAPETDAKIRQTSSKRSFGKWFAWAAIVIVLFSFAYWITTPEYYDPPIPNGRVNLKPGAMEEQVVTGQNASPLLDNGLETEDLPENRINVTPAESVVSGKEMISISACTIVVGSFLNPANSEKLLNNMRNKGFEVSLTPYNSFTRVGVVIDCRHTATQLEELRRMENKDAWLLED